MSLSSNTADLGENSIRAKGYMYEWKFATNKLSLNSPLFSFPLKHNGIYVIVCQLLIRRVVIMPTPSQYCQSYYSCLLKLISCGGLESVTIRYTLSFPGVEDKTEEITGSSNKILGEGIKISSENTILGAGFKIALGNATIKCYIEIVRANPIKTKPRAEIDFDLSRDLTTALTTPEFTDCTLCVGDQELKTHKFLLAARSPVFAAMFRQDMKESKTGKVEIIDFEFEVIEEMINFIYTGTSPRNKTMADRLLEAADKYRIEGLVTLCGVTLAEGLSVENAVSTLFLGDRYSALDLKMAAVRFIVSNLSDVKKTIEWRTLCEERKDLFFELFCRQDEVTMCPGVSA